MAPRYLVCTEEDVILVVVFCRQLAWAILRPLGILWVLVKWAQVWFYWALIDPRRLRFLRWPIFWNNVCDNLQFSIGVLLSDFIFVKILKLYEVVIRTSVRKKRMANSRWRSAVRSKYLTDDRARCDAILRIWSPEDSINNYFASLLKSFCILS